MPPSGPPGPAPSGSRRTGRRSVIASPGRVILNVVLLEYIPWRDGGSYSSCPLPLVSAVPLCPSSGWCGSDISMQNVLVLLTQWVGQGRAEWERYGLGSSHRRCRLKATTRRVDRDDEQATQSDADVLRPRRRTATRRVVRVFVGG